MMPRKHILQTAASEFTHAGALVRIVDKLQDFITEVDRIVGAQPKAEIVRRLMRAIT